MNKDLFTVPTDISVLLPPNAGVAIMDVVKDSIPEIPVDAIALTFYTKVAQVLSLNRAKVKSAHIRDNKQWVFPNIYSITFMPSGSGKDRMVDLIDRNFCADIFGEFKSKYEDIRKAKKEQLRNEALAMYPKSKTLQAEHIKSNELHKCTLETSRGTPQALTSYRLSFSIAGIGGMLFKHSEFADYFMGTDENHEPFLDIFKEAYEGDTGGTILKTGISIPEVKGVPMNMLVHTSAFDFITNEYKRDKVYRFFARGYARRCFVCMKKKLDDKKELSTDYTKRLEALKSGESKRVAIIQDVKSWFWDVYNNTKTDNTYQLSDNADILLIKYEDYLYEVAVKHNARGEKEHLSSEITGRKFRVIKLACVIGAFEHPQDKTIGEYEVGLAIKLTELYVGQYRKFFSDAEKSDHIKLLEFFTNKNNLSKWLKTGDIRGAGLIYNARFTKWFDDNLSILEDYLIDSDYILEKAKLPTNGYKYRITQKKKSKRYDDILSEFMGEQQSEINAYNSTHDNPKAFWDKNEGIIKYRYKKADGTLVNSPTDRQSVLDAL